MTEESRGRERREFLRYAHREPVHYNIVTESNDKTAAAKLIEGISKDLSRSGILFTSKKAPDLPSIIMLDLDNRTSRICREIEENALTVNNKFVGRVVRVEDNENGFFDVGVAFVKKSEALPKTLRDLLK